jgi:hypothetical protein
MAQANNRTQGKAPAAATAAKAVTPAAAQETPKQELVTRAESAQAVATSKADALPAYMNKSGKDRGSEHVAMEDLVVPRIEIVQALSPCLKKNDAAYIEGAEVGMLFNSVTRELYGFKVPVIPVHFKKQWLVWKDRKKGGGGFGGAYDTVQDANERIKQEDPAEQALWAPQDTAQQLVLVIKPDGDTEEALVSMARTKLKVSKNWNSLIRLNGFDRFSRFYILFSVDEMNANGDDYKNFAIANGGYPTELHYKKAEALYEAVASGERKIVMDTSDAGESGGAGGGTEY